MPPRGPRYTETQAREAVADSLRGSLKRRLYATGLKQRRCELCGQGEDWRGRPMALILDHINGVATDNRIENLRIVCPNCASTLDTHCGRNLRLIQDRTCEECGASYRPNQRKWIRWYERDAEAEAA
jgi:HNH endonuclease